MKDYIKIGVEQGYISFDKEMSRITYIYQNKQRNYNNPEEKVQAETFLRLILDYKYPVNRIKQFVPVTMGSEVKEADIVVYEDDMCMSPHILVECKRQEVSEAEYPIKLLLLQRIHRRILHQHFAVVVFYYSLSVYGIRLAELNAESLCIYAFIGFQIIIIVSTHRIKKYL